MDAMLQDMITKPARLVWTHHGLPPDDIERLTLGNAPDPLVNSPFKLGTAAQTAVGLSALAAAHLYALRTGIEQNVHVDPRHAIIEFNSENYYTINGTLPAPRQDDELTGVYQAQDGWIRLNTNFPKDKAGVIELLQCEPTRKSVDEVIKKWSAFDFIDLAMKRGFCAAGLRSFESIDNHQQGKSTVNISPVTIERIGDAPRRPPTAPSGSHPLSGVRVIEMTRVLAGPLASRTLAAHGADVLSVSKPGLPRILEYDIDTNRGKRMTQLDLDVPDECNKFNELLRGADVFVQCYRPGSLDKRGLGAKDVAKMRPGIVHASLSAFAHTSLYKGRTGYEEEVQFVGGYAVQEAESYKEWFGNSDPDIPAYRAMPMSAISHLAGQFLAFGIMTALSKTVTEGGSWEVHVSLESVALWLRHLGLLTAEEAHNEGKPLPERLAGAALDEEVAALSTRVEWDEGDAPRHLFETAGSTVTAVRHAAELEATPVRVGRVPKGLGVHDAKWLPRD